jgi:cytochrome c peroxidase
VLTAQALFSSSDLGVAGCHSGPAFRNDQYHDMGTITMNSGNRLNGSLTEIRTPTLIELWDSAPYFHDGSAATLGDVVSRGTHTRNYNGTQMQDLVEYLRSIDRELYIDDDANFDGVGSP